MTTVKILEIVSADKPGESVKMALLPKPWWVRLWEAVAPWLTFAAAVGLGWVVRGGC